MKNFTYLDMLDFAMSAYSDTPTSDIFHKLHFEDCRDIGVQFFIGRHKQSREMIIAFRGTDNFLDFKVDMDFWKMQPAYGNSLSKIRVHRGFYKAYHHECVRNKIRYFLKPDIEKIYITGHSMGAALAMLCAVDLQYNFPDKYYEVVVFGCPRVGNKAFVKSFNKRIIKTLRFENGNDIVTKLPPCLFGFSHAGIKIHIGFPRIFGMYSLKHHNAMAYYEKLIRRF